MKAVFRCVLGTLWPLKPVERRWMSCLATAPTMDNSSQHSPCNTSLLASLTVPAFSPNSQCPVWDGECSELGLQLSFPLTFTAALSVQGAGKPRSKSRVPSPSVCSPPLPFKCLISYLVALAQVDNSTSLQLRGTYVTPNFKQLLALTQLASSNTLLSNPRTGSLHSSRGKRRWLPRAPSPARTSHSKSALRPVSSSST
jgi:hypothetical protein